VEIIVGGWGRTVMYSIIAILAIIQLFLLVFTFGIAREVFIAKSQRQAAEAWPILNLSPGDLLPEIALHHKTAVAPEDSGAFILCAVTEDGLGQMLLSLQLACHAWSKEFFLISESDGLASYCSKIVTDLRQISIFPQLSRSFGLLGNTILFAQDGRLVDASSLSKTPSSIRDRFYFVGQ
jgi:hypothetical protein